MIMDRFCSILVFDSFIQYIVMVPLGKRWKKEWCIFEPFWKKQKLGSEGEELQISNVFLESVSEKQSICLYLRDIAFGRL